MSATTSQGSPGALELLPESETTFFFPDFGGSVESILENGETVGMLASGTVRGRKL